MLSKIFTASAGATKLLASDCDALKEASAETTEAAVETDTGATELADEAETSALTEEAGATDALA